MENMILISYKLLLRCQQECPLYELRGAGQDQGRNKEDVHQQPLQLLHGWGRRCGQDVGQHELPLQI